MMIDVMTLLIMACCVCSGLSVAFMFYSYNHPDKVPFMQGFWDTFKNKGDDDDVVDTMGPREPLDFGPVTGTMPTTCVVTAADRTVWQQQCNNNQQCIAQEQSRKCGPLTVVNG